MGEDLAEALGGFGPGSRIAGYLLEEQIGQGGMAVVFRAVDERLHRRVALKILAPAIAADEAFRARFIRESQAAAAVDDPHIIPVYEAGKFGTVAVAFSPDGRTLASSGYTGQTYLWNIATASKISTLTDPGAAGSTVDVQADQFSPDGQAIATGDTNGAAYLWTPR